jgi:hypothetical protein
MRSSDGWEPLTTLLPADHQVTLRPKGIDTLSSPSPTPYGSILSFTWIGLDAKLFPNTSIYSTLGRTSRSSVCT